MSQAVSPSTSRSYGLARVARAWRVSRAGVYRFLKSPPPIPTITRRPGPVGAVWTRNWRIISARKSLHPAFTERATARFGAAALQWGSRQPSTRPAGDERKRLARAHRAERRDEKIHDGTIVTDKVTRCGD